MTVRYGAVLSSLRSLAGEPAIATIAPTECDVAYRSSWSRSPWPRGIAPLVDIYVPPRPCGASVVLVHGGAFVIGSRRMKPMRLLAAQLFAARIAVCAVDYRMLFRGGRLDDAVDDVGTALDVWRARSSAFDLDPDAITLAGLSAGATLAMLAASRGASIAALACCFGLYELDQLRGAAALLPRLLLGTRDRDAWTARSPSAVAQPAMPTLLLHGDDDGLVPVEQARRLAARREALGLPTRLVVYPGAPHSFFNEPCAAAGDAVCELVQLARCQIGNGILRA